MLIPMFLKQGGLPGRFPAVSNKAIALILLVIPFLMYRPSASLGAVTYSATDLYVLTLPQGFIGSPSQYGIVSGSAVGTGHAGAGVVHALTWSQTGTPTDLNPSTFVESYAFGTDGTHQIGYGYGSPTLGNVIHAMYWTGSSSSAVDLTPNNFSYSDGEGVGGGEEVGYGYGPATANVIHALMWNGSSNAATDLHPASGFGRSYAEGTDGTYQVGYGGLTADGGSATHALLWKGTAASVIDLQPSSGFTSSTALAVNNGQEVGHGATTGGSTHALLWSGSSASVLDLNPANFNESYATATNGLQQVGYGDGTSTGGNYHALLWNGDANDVVDLQSALDPTDLFSEAYSIDANGNIFGFAMDASRNLHAIEWSVGVPEPGALMFAALAGLLLVRRRHDAQSATQ